MRKFVPVVVISLCIMLSFGMSRAEDVKVGQITGQLMVKGGGSMSGGMVFLYSDDKPLPSYDKYWRVPDFVLRINEQGKFMDEVLEGTYCLGAIKRKEKQQIGPPAEGDLFFLSLEKKGMPKKYVIKKGEKLDVGVIAEAVPYKKPATKEGLTAIEGTVVDGNGKPVEGALVFAFVTPTIVGKPLFVSDRSAKDGKFLLRVHEGGSYYLKVRGEYGGGPPTASEVVDVYGKKAPEAELLKVTVKTGEIAKGIALTGVKFPGRGRDVQQNMPQGKRGGEVSQ